MARPDKYRLADGTVVPSVTTILDRFKPAGGLIHWAWSQGKAGLDYRQSRDAAAEAGSLAHKWIEATIKGEGDKFVIPANIDPDVFCKAEQAHENFLKWYAKSGFTILEQEVPLVSEAWKFGGTPDAIARKGVRKPKIIMLDFKTSKRVYHEHLYQVAAYGLLQVECTAHGWPDEYHILQLDKETAKFSHKPFVDLTQERNAFLKLREAYDLIKQCEARKL